MVFVDVKHRVYLLTYARRLVVVSVVVGSAIAVISVKTGLRQTKHYSSIYRPKLTMNLKLVTRGLFSPWFSYHMYLCLLSSFTRIWNTLLPSRNALCIKGSEAIASIQLWNLVGSKQYVSIFEYVTRAYTPPPPPTTTKQTIFWKPNKQTFENKENNYRHTRSAVSLFQKRE